MQFIFALFWLFCILGEIYRNFFIIELQRKRPTYCKSMIYRIGVGILLNIAYTYKIDTTILLRYFSIEFLLLQLTSFGVLFDPGLNLIRGEKKLTYINTSKGAGWWDKILTSLGRAYIMYLWVELLAFGTAIAIYVEGWNVFISKVNGSWIW